MGGKWLHRLTEKDPKAKTAVCAACGPVKIYKRKGRSWRCHSVVIAENKIRNEKAYKQGGRWLHRLTEKDPKAKTALCAACGPVKIIKKKKVWRCHPATLAENKVRNKRAHERGRLANVKTGCSCAICGYARCADALEFHHVNPAEKLTEIGKRLGFPLRKILRTEIPKCILICANCHRELHAGLFTQEFIEGLPRARVPESPTWEPRPLLRGVRTGGR